MRTIFYIFLFAGFLSLWGGPAEARNNRSGRNVNLYRGMDLNEDNMITRAEWEKAFEAMDWNGDGVLSGDEMKPGARRPYAREVESYDEFNAMDRNNDGIISPREWTGRPQGFDSLDISRDGKLTRDEFYRRVASDQFSGIDSNNDGSITRNEWRNTDRSFEVLDRNRDGRLSREEFYDQRQYTVSVFQELDLNGDGRIAREEWLGTAEDFNRLDTDGNDHLSESEFNNKRERSIAGDIFQALFKKE